VEGLRREKPQNTRRKTSIPPFGKKGPAVLRQKEDIHQKRGGVLNLLYETTVKC